MLPTQGHLCDLLTGLETSSPNSQQNALSSLVFKENPGVQLVCKIKGQNLKIFIDLKHKVHLYVILMHL